MFGRKTNQALSVSIETESSHRPAISLCYARIAAEEKLKSSVSTVPRRRQQMAKKRDRRLAPGSNRSKEIVEPSTEQDQLGNSASSDRRLIIIFVIFFIVSPAISVLVYRIIDSPPPIPLDSLVFQGGLVKADVNYQEILTVSTVLQRLACFGSCFNLFGC